MSVLALDYHYSPVLAFIDFLKKLIYRKVFFLKINIRHANLVKILYFIIGFFHIYKCSKDLVKDKRYKHKSNASVFHTEKGGAVPTITHQKARG